MDYATLSALLEQLDSRREVEERRREESICYLLHLRSPIGNKSCDGATCFLRLNCLFVLLGFLMLGYIAPATVLYTEINSAHIAECKSYPD
ncbi:UNVERIFIED_CONTAM: hypothetical protein FKN15_067229 [Acipenser sinensis]